MSTETQHLCSDHAHLHGGQPALGSSHDQCKMCIKLGYSNESPPPKSNYDYDGDLMSTEEELDGITGKQFLEELFRYEYCTDCGLDADAHTAIPLGLGDYGTNWFARCDMAYEDDCNRCGKIVITPIFDEGDQRWRPQDQWRVWCSPRCHEDDAEADGVSGPLGRSDPR